jgi:phage FluMu protein Com
MNTKPGHEPDELTHEVDPDKIGEVRCECGRLQARLTETGVEIKCKRCKRVTIIPLKKGKSRGR